MKIERKKPLSHPLIFIFSLLLLLTTQFSIACNVELPTDKSTKDKPTKDKDKNKDKNKDDDSSKDLGSKQLQVHMLDIGQGDSLLIITPEKKS
ncbi:MAG: hypothetical protein FD167_5102, partial [bacterium]